MIFSKILTASLIGASFVVAQLQPLQLDFDVVKSSVNTLSKRDSGALNVTLLNDAIIYYATIYLGSDKQKQMVQIDTGSSDLWVMNLNVQCYNTNGGLISQGLCTANGTFNSQKSLTFNVNSTLGPFELAYVDGSGAVGVYGQDSLSIGNVTISNMTLGVANMSSSTNPVFGIGLPQLETSNGLYGVMYPNFPQLLKQQGHIHKVVYSLFLNEQNATSGSILFGAVDHGKYTGQLQTVPIVNADGSPEIDRLRIVLNSISFDSGAGTVQATNQSLAVLIDSGSQVSYLPREMIDEISQIMGAKPDPVYSNSLIVSCAYAKLNLNITFNFSGALIKVPLSEFILQQNSKCTLGLRVGSSFILGDNFLSNVYVVYDLQDLEISVAPASFQGDSQLEIVTSTIPNAVKAPQYSLSTFYLSFSFQSALTTLSVSGLSSPAKKSDAERPIAHGIYAAAALFVVGLFFL